MNKQKVVSLLVIILGLAGLVWWSKSVDSNAPPANQTNSGTVSGSALTAEETFYDFGTISMKNGNVSTIFKVTNSGTEEVNLTNVSTSCMCTAAYILKVGGGKIGPFGMPGHGGNVSMPGHGNGAAGEVIPAGESRDIEVVYDPNAHGPAGVGMVDRFIYLQTENGQKLELEIKANVTP